MAGAGAGCFAGAGAGSFAGAGAGCLASVFFEAGAGSSAGAGAGFLAGAGAFTGTCLVSFAGEDSTFAALSTGGISGSTGAHSAMVGFA